jgi:hypothetical protein
MLPAHGPRERSGVDRVADVHDDFPVEPRAVGRDEFLGRGERHGEHHDLGRVDRAVVPGPGADFGGGGGGASGHGADADDGDVHGHFPFRGVKACRQCVRVVS